MELSRYDIGYTLINRFEILLRDKINEYLVIDSGINWKQRIPKELFDQFIERNNSTPIESATLEDILDESELRHLFEIILIRDNKSFIHDKIDKNYLNNMFIETNKLRQQIAHSKSSFDILSLSKLISLIEELNNTLLNMNEELSSTISDIKSGRIDNCEKVPLCFLKYTETKSKEIPNNLPQNDYTKDGGFIGREEDILSLTKLFESDLYRIITIIGAGGVGKTALAHEFCSKKILLSEQYECLIWISAKEEILSSTGIEKIEPELKHLEDIYNAILSVYGFDIDNIEQKREYVELILKTSSKPIVIIIDNLETITDESIINFIKEIPQPNKVLITSRLGLGEIEKLYPLKELKIKDAIRLFRTISKEKGINDLVKLPDASITSITNKVSNYPLAIKWLIGKIVLGSDIESSIDDVGASDGDIALFCFKNIFNDSLSITDKDILFALSLFDNPVSMGMICHVTDINQKDIQASILKLIKASLVTNIITDSVETKYALIPLTRNFIYSKLKENNEKYDTFKSKYTTIQLLTHEATDAHKQYKYSLSAMGAETEEEKIASTKCLLAYQSSDYIKATEILHKAKEIAPNFPSVYKIWASIEANEGHYNTANDLMRKATSLKPTDPVLWLHWGNIIRKNNSLQEALNHYFKALNISPNDPHILGVIGETFKWKGDYEQAIKYLKLSCENSNQEIGSRSLIISYTSMADTLRRWSEHLLKNKEQTNSETLLNDVKEKIDKALEYINKAKNLGEDKTIKTTYNEIVFEKANILYICKDFDKAIDFYNEALGLIPKHKIKDRTKHFLGNYRLAKIYATKKDITKFERHKKNAKYYAKSKEQAKSVDFIEMHYDNTPSKGIITMFNKEKKYGFINNANSTSHFFHISDFCGFISEQVQNELIGSKVEFITILEENGKYRATQIILTENL